jgi:hypothetical protein
MHRRSLKKKRKAIETVKEIVLDYKNKHRGDIDQLGEHICRSSHAGIFLFAPLIENDNLLDIVNPIPAREKAKRYFLSLLALKPLGIKPEWIIIDSKVTNYKNSAKIAKTEAKIVTIRYRSKKMVEEARNIEDWEVVRLKRTKGGYVKVRADEKPLTRRYKDDDGKRKNLELREVIVTDNGREKPMFIITTDFEHSIKDIIDTFLTQIAHALYCLTAKNLRGYENAEPETLYKEFVLGWGRIYNHEDKIIVCLSKKRSTGSLINAPFLEGFVDGGKYISWLGKKLEFVWM